ncbi:unnamed protein product [Gongylonema pulchrum]|uniref:Uncharacterized protein n=1 Tax=Gongylonema pulchrum TaxID=637853 RepID=A0A3P7MLP8_9BILA|nr:unnamed protein product [Gongylonema pulchrum]
MVLRMVADLELLCYCDFLMAAVSFWRWKIQQHLRLFSSSWPVLDFIHRTISWYWTIRNVFTRMRTTIVHFANLNSARESWFIWNENDLLTFQSAVFVLIDQLWENFLHGNRVKLF